MHILGGFFQQSDKTGSICGPQRLQRIKKDRPLQLTNNLRHETNAIGTDVQLPPAERQELVSHVEKVVGHSQFVSVPSSWEPLLKVLKMVPSISSKL